MLRSAFVFVALAAPTLSFAQSIPGPDDFFFDDRYDAIIEAVLQLIEDSTPDIEPFEPDIGDTFKARCAVIRAGAVDPDVDPALECDAAVDGVYNGDLTRFFDGDGPWGVGAANESLVEQAKSAITLPLTQSEFDNFVNDESIVP